MLPPRLGARLPKQLTGSPWPRTPSLPQSLQLQILQQGVRLCLGALKMHIRSHTRPASVVPCGKAFPGPGCCRATSGLHTGESHSPPAPILSAPLPAL